MNSTHAQCSGQQSCYHAAAQAYANAAAQCPNPAGAACMRQFASYYQGCGDSCGSPPTCSTSCASTGTGAGIATVSPATTAAEKAIAADQNKVQQVDNLVNMGISLFTMFHSNNSSAQPDANSAPAPDPAAEAAAEAAAQQQAYNAEAASLLASADAMLPSTSAAPAPAQPDPDSLLNNLLDDNAQPTDTSTSEISNLLDSDDAQPDSGAMSAASESAAPDPTTTLSNLLTSDNSSPVNGSIPQEVVPQDPATDSAMQESTDDPNQDQSNSLGQMLQNSAVQPVQDALSGLVTSGNDLISSVADDPVVQWATSDQGSLTTIPLPAAGDDPDTATNKVFGQSIVGMNDLIKGLAGGPVDWAKGLYSYGTKMVNQMGADLGLANAQISGAGQENSQ